MSRITLGNMVIDRARFEVWVDDQRIDLTFVEFELLYHLAKNAGRVLARPRLMQAVWNERSSGEDRKLTVHMSRLRKKLRGSAPWTIETTTKRGYALVDGSGMAYHGEETPEEAADSGRQNASMLGRPA